MRLAFDMASYLWTALRAGKDKENGVEVLHDDKKVWVNSAQYGYDHCMNMMLRAMRMTGVTPHRCLLVFEGMHSKKRRQAIEPTYKANRDKDKPPEAYVQYEAAIKMIEQAWKDVGAISMRQAFVEGDDVLAYLALHSEDDITITTYDNDLCALHGTNPQGRRVDVLIDGVVGRNKYGDFSHHLITLYKALVGDITDNIKGCPGFGVKTWETFRLTYGDEGLEEVLRLLAAGSLDELNAQRDDDKTIRLLCDQAPQTLRSYQLAKLHPEWVNNRTTALVVTPGMCKVFGPDADSRLSHWAGTTLLVTADNLNEAQTWIKSQFKVSPFVALDIETTTPPEADEWLANQVPPNPDGVDVMGSTLAGMSLTFGDNLQHTVYISVDHAETSNVSSEQVRQLVEAIPGDTVIQNLAFELPVLYQAWADKQEDNGCHGFLPRCLDTKLEASYVNENEPLGMKGRSLMHLGYKQQTFQETMQISGPVGTLRPGGRQLKVFEQTLQPRRYYHDGTLIDEGEAERLDKLGEEVEFDEAVTQEWETRQYKMHEVPATHVFGYGCDDTICTAALHNYYRLIMELEHTWQVYLDVEIDAAYMSAVGFLQGTCFSAAKMRELVEEDDKTYDAAWATVRTYLLSKGWPGSVCPEFGPSSKPADLKLAYQIVTGKVLDSQVRKVDKLAALIAAEGEETLAALLLGAVKSPSEWAAFNKYVHQHFKGEPDFNIGSPKQKQRLLYEVMGLPIRLRNKPTDQMRAAGIREGGAKTDALAIDHALAFDAKEENKPEERKALQSLKLMQMVETRRSLFYSKYPGHVHWRTGRLHSTVNQCEANTRRSSESAVNKQQLSKRPGPDGEIPRFRETIVPHHTNAVIVSLDEKSQELRIIADYSHDSNMVSCFVGDDQKDMHSLTGLGIAQWRYPEDKWTYDLFVKAYKDPDHPLHMKAVECRTLGKTTNFSASYGIMALKLSERMIVEESAAQAFLDAREAAFPGEGTWKEKVVADCKSTGITRTKMGAVRHLRDAFNSSNSYESSKAERQGPSFMVQSSAAEQVKRAMGSMWKRRLVFKYDAEFIGAIHDEVVFSVGIPDLLEFLVETHAAMTQPYGGMWIPIESSISFGRSFGVDDQTEIGSLPTAEAVKYGLSKLEKTREGACTAH